ncbi:MAG TPA: sigma-70 family RNA polymerase sigma factor [Acidimicrobiales bacterium]|nr:sigma-70 family RNA polymerase sigma factor [Acidimicrobiales bacterium]
MAVRARPDNLSLDDPSGDGPRPVDFAALWALRGNVRSLSARMVGDGGEPDDVVQDTFLRALRKGARLQRRTSYAPWLATVARRRAIDELRLRKRLEVVAAPPEPPPSHGADPLEHVLRQEAVDRVRAALGELSGRERRLLLRQVSHGLSIAELAEAEATTVASVRSVLTRARAKLRAAVEKDGPLGVLPLPGLAAAIRRRLPRPATALDGRAPVLASVVFPLRDVVMAVAAAAALLLAGTAADPSGTGGAGTPAASQGAGDAGHVDASARPATGAGSGVEAEVVEHRAPGAGATAAAPPTTLVPSPSEYVDVPWLRDAGGGEPEAAVIRSLVASADGRVVLAAGSTNTGGRPSVYRSVDAGHSWERLEAKGYLGGRLLVAPSYPADRTILASAEGGPLWRSDDDGRFFLPAAPGRGPAALVPGYGPGNRRVVLATPQLLLYDVDSGTTSPLGLGPAAVELGGVAATPDFSVDPVVLVGGAARSGSHSAATVYRCRSTSPCTASPLPGAPAAPTIHVSSQTGVVLAHARQTLHRSTDGGVTFTQVPLPTGITVQNVVDGAPGELLLAGTLPEGSTAGGLLRSTDGGATWAPLGTGTALAGGSMHVVRLADGTILAALRPSLGGLLCSVDDGATWAGRCPAPAGSAPRIR